MTENTSSFFEYLLLLDLLHNAKTAFSCSSTRGSVFEKSSHFRCRSPKSWRKRISHGRRLNLWWAQTRSRITPISLRRTLYAAEEKMCFIRFQCLHHRRRLAVSDCGHYFIAFFNGCQIVGMFKWLIALWFLCLRRRVEMRTVDHRDVRVCEGIWFNCAWLRLDFLLVEFSSIPEIAYSKPGSVHAHTL